MVSLRNKASPSPDIINIDSTEEKVELWDRKMKKKTQENEQFLINLKNSRIGDFCSENNLLTNFF